MNSHSAGRLSMCRHPGRSRPIASPAFFKIFNALYALQQSYIRCSSHLLEPALPV